MIIGFTTETEPLNDDERKLLPQFVNGLRTKIGKEKAITNKQIRSKFKDRGVSIPDSRVRKIINHIRINGLVELLCASSNGYYIAKNDKEINEYMIGLKSRIEAQNLVLNKLIQQYTQGKI